MLTINKLLKIIIEYNDLPKFQVERAISPILSYYIDKIISKNDDELELISPEYPLKKENNQSTNVDYLLINKTKNSIILVELKTNFRATAKIVLKHQHEYERVIDNVYKNKASFLVNDIKTIMDATNEKEKYEYLINKSNRINDEFNKGEIVYLVPETIKKKILEKGCELKYTSIVSFNEIKTNGQDDRTYRELVDALKELK